MKKFSGLISILLVILLISFSFTSCKKTVNPIKFTTGTFPTDSVYNLSGINSPYDDYNSDLYILGGSQAIIFSSNRGSSGGQFDLVQGSYWFKFDQTNGDFSVGGEIINDPFFTTLLSTANTSGNDYGPLTHFSTSDGYEYLLLSSQNAGGPLDLYYLRYQPRFNNNIPPITGPLPVRKFNTGSNEGYISFDSNEDSAYFSSDRNGNYDIFVHKKLAGKALNAWMDSTYIASTPVDSVNSADHDKCPFIFKNVMVFTSNRPGGFGGYDIYYSIFRNRKWSSPVNMGSKVNTESDEYRPVLANFPGFTNTYMIFSSDRSGGEGYFDLYFTGVTFPK
jgi:hypothetical protein